MCNSVKERMYKGVEVIESLVYKCVAVVEGQMRTGV